MMMGAMEHDEVRELLEDAAVEPGGLERLMAGDTPAAAVVAGHLAGCPECTDELDRLRRTVALVRPAVRSVPPPELRERTLAYVSAGGRQRAPSTSAGVAPSAAVASPRLAPPSDPPAPTRRFGMRRLRALAALAAVLIVAVTGTGLL